MLRICTFQQGFETRTGPYGPTGKTSNRSCLRFVKPQEPLHGKIAGTRENHGRTSRFWEPWSNRFSRFPASVNLKLKKKKKTNKHRKTKEKETQLCWEYIMSSETLPLPSPEKHNMSLCFFFFFSLQSTSRSSLYSKILLLGESSFKFRLCSPPVMCVW